MEDWHLSRNVPITLFLLLIIQAVSVMGAFTEVEVGVEQNAKDIVEVEDKLDTLDARQRDLQVKVARIDENILQMKAWMEQDRK
jgi:Na+-transporting methylmalonyl-CoA/oxaloacetate decarboxylase gamma subunit